MQQLELFGKPASMSHVDTGTATARKIYRDHDGNLHRTDGPAIEWDNGREAWYKHGLRHRVGGPAVTEPAWKLGMGTYEEWIVEGRLHRTDGPAVVHAEGSVQYFIDGLLTDENDPRLKINPQVMHERIASSTAKSYI